MGYRRLSLCSSVRLSSGCVFWHFAAITAQLRRIFLTVPPMSTVVVTSARPTQCRRWSFHQLNGQLGDRVFPRGCGQGVERPSADDQGLTVAADVPPTT